jgi:hypothetical protein
LLAAPALAYVLGLARGNAQFIFVVERRQPFGLLPASQFLTDTPRYTRRFESVVADNFPFRRPLIGAYDALKFFALQEPVDSRVTRGRDGWLFWDVAGTVALTRSPPGAVTEIVDFYRARAAWCAAHGAHYVLLVSPEKSLLYPEEFPRGVRPPGRAFMLRLIALLRRAGVDAVDALSAIAAAKDGGDVYDRGDTHWNARGAYAAYEALVGDVGLPNAVAGRLVRQEVIRTGDLFGIAGVSDFISDRHIDLVLPHPRSHAAVAALGPNVRVTRIADSRLPTAVVFGDSFAMLLERFLQENFRRAAFLVVPGHEPFDPHLVEAEHPRFVIQEILLRQLTTDLEALDPSCYYANRDEPSPPAVLPAKVRVVEGGTLASIDWVNSIPLGGRVRMSVAADRLTTLDGWAVDAPHVRRARALFVRVDGGRVTRADTCLERADVAAAYASSGYHRSGFEMRLALRPGSHRISLDVLSGDGTTLYRDVRPLTLDE